MLLRDTFRLVMEKHDYDPHTMATKLGVTPNTIWRYLSGKVSPSTEALTRLAELGKLDFTELLAQKAVEANAHRSSIREGAIRLKAGKVPTVSQRAYKARTLGLTAKLSEGEMNQIKEMLSEILERLSKLEQHTRPQRGSKNG